MMASAHVPSRNQPESATLVHVINHTHWDREWFLTSVYTSRWIPGLIDKIESLVGSNPNFQYLFDGQTLVIEDLLALAPQYEPRVRKLIADGRLIIGPYYCQPDWQMTGGETLIRNLLYGRQDMRRYGGQNATGWLVDTFGHTSQTPQLHRLFGIDSVFVWRGVPLLEPYFQWQGANGHSLFTIDLFGGYRNLYGVTQVPEVAVNRLKSETDKLRPFYPSADIPMFDGYDLEQSPEDPLRFYQQQAGIPAYITLQESSPGDFTQAVRQQKLDLPTIQGELNSGKYGATFPGTLSARTYLKVMNRDCEHILYQLAEPLAVLAFWKGRDYPSQQFEAWSRMLLQNTVHDCLCGVSIDQVHEKMEYSYRQIFEGAQQQIQASLDAILRDFAPGTYAVSTNSFPTAGWQAVDDKLYAFETAGVGVWPVGKPEPIKTPNLPVETFTWQNSHYQASMHPDGTVEVGQTRLGRLVVMDEQGDTYSDEVGDRRTECFPVDPMVIREQSAWHSVVEYGCMLQRDGIQVSANVLVTFDQTPFIRWQVNLDSQGKDFQVNLEFESRCSGSIYAGMPFDVVQRPAVDNDLLPAQLDTHLAPILLGQRELAPVKTFPFQEFVAVSDGKTTTAVLAKGLHAYQADEDGTLRITLRRSVEQLTRPNLKYRLGDAGPFFYVPDARCERSVRHALAVFVSSSGVEDKAFHQLNAGFQNPPLLVQVQGEGKQKQWQVFQESVPLCSLHYANHKVMARLYNPIPKPWLLSRVYQQADVFGNFGAVSDVIPGKGIFTVALEAGPFPTASVSQPGQVTLLAGPEWRVGQNHGLPDLDVIDRLEKLSAGLEDKLAQIEEQRKQAAGVTQHLLQHQYYIVRRELLETRLSYQLNAEKLTRQGALLYSALYEPDEDIARIGLELNQMRTKRRIYDYVVTSL